MQTQWRRCVQANIKAISPGWWESMDLPMRAHHLKLRQMGDDLQRLAADLMLGLFGKKRLWLWGDNVVAFELRVRRDSAWLQRWLQERLKAAGFT
jgi:hypothetical protein